MAFLDTSVLLASLDPDESAHATCDRLLAQGGHQVYTQALAETFSILTGGRKGQRISAATAAQLISASLLPYLAVQTLSGKDLMDALKAAEARGARGGAVYDWLHLAAAHKARADVFYTLNLRDLQALGRPGDPVISLPE